MSSPNELLEKRITHLEDMLVEQGHVLKEHDEDLRSLRASRRRGRIFKAIYWFVVIGIFIGTLSFIMPLYRQAQQTLQSFQGAEDGGSGFDVQGNINEIMNLLQ